MGSLRTLNQGKNKILLWYLEYALPYGTHIMVYQRRNRTLYSSFPSSIYYRTNNLVLLEDIPIIEEENKTWPHLHQIEYIPINLFCNFGCGSWFKRDGYRERHKNKGCDANPSLRACPSCAYEKIDGPESFKKGDYQKGRYCLNPQMDCLNDYSEDRPLYPMRHGCELWEYRFKRGWI